MRKNEELKEALKYMNNIRGDITKWQEDTKNFLDKTLGYDRRKKIEEKIEEDKILLSDISGRITSATIESMKQFKENVDAFVSDYKSMETSLPEKVKTVYRGILFSYLEYFNGTRMFNLSKDFLPKKDYNQILTAHKGLISHLEKAMESLGSK